MSGAIATSWAFFLRDLRLAASYRVGFAFEIVGALVNVAIFFFISEFLGGALQSSLAGYGGEYFPFVIIGIAFTSYLTVGLNGISSKIRDGQLMGTLELMLISPTRLPVILVSSALWAHAMTTFGVLTYVVAGVLLGVDLAGANLLPALVALVLAIIGFNAIGLLAAAIIIVVKQGSPVAWIVSTASVLLAGVFYPSSVLPEPVHDVAQLIPLTHALEIVRRSLLLGEGFATLAPHFAALVGLTALLIPLGVAACHAAVKVAQRDGSLSSY